MPLPHSVTVGPEALRLAMTSAGLGEPHVLLLGEPAVLDAESRWAAERAHWAELAGAGLLGAGGVSRRVAEALRPLAQAAVQYFGWLTFTATGETFGAVVGVAAAEATMAVRRGAGVRVCSVPAESPAESLLTAFGEVTPAHGRPVNVSSGGPSHEVDRLAAMARVPPRANAELYVSVRGPLSRVRTSAEPVRFRDTSEGRWALFAGPSSVTVVPAAGQLLADRLYEARRALGAPGSAVF